MSHNNTRLNSKKFVDGLRRLRHQSRAYEQQRSDFTRWIEDQQDRASSAQEPYFHGFADFEWDDDDRRQSDVNEDAGIDPTDVPESQGLQSAPDTAQTQYQTVLLNEEERPEHYHQQEREQLQEQKQEQATNPIPNITQHEETLDTVAQEELQPVDGPMASTGVFDDSRRRNAIVPIMKSQDDEKNHKQDQR